MIWNGLRLGHWRSQAGYDLSDVLPKYWSFKIGDELNDKYRLEVSGYSGDANNSLQYEGEWDGDGNFGGYYHSGMAFTTYDQDNDRYWTNCASTRGGGWWFNDCFWVCLMCKATTYEWYSEVYVANSRMMIKPQ